MEPYLILGVSEDDSFDTIRRKYRKMCLLYHPDKIEKDASDETKELRKQMFQNITLSYEKIAKEREERSGEKWQNISAEFSKKDIQDIIDFFINSIYSKVSAFTEHPLYRCFISFGMNGLLTLFQRGNIKNLDVINIDVEWKDIVNPCTIEFDYRSFQKDIMNGNTIEQVNHIKAEGKYPFILCKNKGDFGKDLVVILNLKGEKPIFNHQTKRIIVNDLEETLMNQKVSTYFGDYILIRNEQKQN